MATVCLQRVLDPLHHALTPSTGVQREHPTASKAVAECRCVGRGLLESDSVCSIRLDKSEMETKPEENSHFSFYAFCVLRSNSVFHRQRNGGCERYSV